MVERIGGRTGSEPGALDAPGGVSVLGDRVLIADFYNHRIQSFGTERPRVLGRPRRVGAARLNYATDVAVSDSLVYVADAYHHRIQVFDGRGRYLGRAADSLNLPTAAARGDRGQLYVADFGNARIVRFERTGTEG